jgi:hypothetical protein
MGEDDMPLTNDFLKDMYAKVIETSTTLTNVCTRVENIEKKLEDSERRKSNQSNAWKIAFFTVLTPIALTILISVIIFVAKQGGLE